MTTEPTTQAGKALLNDIGQLVRTVRIVAKVPDSEIVPGATRQHFLERIAAIEATARAEAEVSDQAHAQLVADYDAALANAARLRNAVDAAVQNIAHDRVGAAVAGLRAALAALRSQAASQPDCTCTPLQRGSRGHDGSCPYYLATKAASQPAEPVE